MTILEMTITSFFITHITLWLFIEHWIIEENINFWTYWKNLDEKSAPHFAWNV